MIKFILIMLVAAFLFLQGYGLSPAFAGSCCSKAACNGDGGSCCVKGVCKCPASHCCTDGKCTCSADKGCGSCQCK